MLRNPTTLTYAGAPSRSTTTTTTTSSTTSKPSSTKTDNSPTPTPVQLGHEQAYFGALPTHFSSGTSTANFGAQVFKISDLPPGTQSFVNTIPHSWLDKSSPEQIQALLQDINQFHRTATNALTINPDLDIDPHLSHEPITFDSYGDYRGVTDGPYDTDDTIYKRKDSQREQQDSQWYNSIDISTGFSTARDVFQGFRRGEHAYGEVTAGLDLISNFSSLAGDAEASSLFGDAAISTAESFFGELGFEGTALAGAEFLGGAASIGAFLAGGEVVAGGLLVGYGLYEGAKALGLDKGFSAMGGGSLSREADSVLNQLKGPLESFVHWGEGLFP